MVAVKDGFWLKPDYAALTFFGYIVTSTQQEADLLNKHYNRIKHHEMIHLRQAQSCHDSWFCFYWLYGWYYLRMLPYNRRLKHAAYWLNPFEMEAYLHDHDMDYLKKHDGRADEWRRFARMPAGERASVMKHITG